MATATAQKVKLYKETYDFVERFNKDSTWRISLLNAIKKSGKKNHLGTPLIGYAFIIFKNSPQFATSHGFKLIDSLRNGRFEEFANTLDSLFTQFWKRASDREGLNQEGEKYEAGEVEHPAFVSEDEHEKLQQIESMPEGPAKFAEYENFAQSSIKKFQTPEIHLRGGIEPTLSEHPGGEPISEKAEVPEAFRQWKDIQQPFTPASSSPSIPSKQPIPPIPPPLTAEATPRFQFKSLLQPLKSLRVPQNLSLPIKKFIRRNLTLTRLASVFTGGIGAIVGYGVTNTGVGAVAGGGLGLSIPSLVKSRGAGQLVLTGFTKAGNAGGSFLSGISTGGGGIRGGSFLGRATGGAGKKAALLALLGFVLLSAFLVGFTPAPGTGTTGGQPAPTGGSTSTGGSCPDQAVIDANKKDPNTCKYFGLGVNLFDTNISKIALDAYTAKYSTIFISHGGDIDEFKRRLKYIVDNSQAVGLNPVLFMGYWKTENNFPVADGLRDMGCAKDSVNFEEQVDCALGIKAYSNPFKNPVANCAKSKDANSDACKTLRGNRSQLDLKNPINYPIATFDDFAEAHGSRDPGLDGPGKVNNNCVSTYNKLVEVAKELNACIVSTPTSTPISPPAGSSSQLVTCPLSQNGSGSFRFICGTFNNPRGGGPCGHGNPLYYVACTQPPYASCPFTDQLKAAVDVRPSTGNGGNAIVYLPFVNGNQSVKWTKVKGPEPISGGKDGYKVEYETNSGGKRIRIDLTHLNGTINSAGLESGDVVSTTKASVDKDGGGHLHTAVSVDGKWVDAISEAKLCTP